MNGRFATSRFWYVYNEKILACIYTNYGTLKHPIQPNPNPEIVLNYGTPWLPLVATVLYLINVFLFPKILKALKVPALKLKWLVAFWNLGLSVFSLAVLFGSVAFYYKVYQVMHFHSPNQFVTKKRRKLTRVVSGSEFCQLMLRIRTR
jgi:hypothetical protein